MNNIIRTLKNLKIEVVKLSLTEIIKDMQNGILVPPQNPKEISEAIVYLLENPEKQKEFGEEIKKNIVSFFSLEKMLSEMIKLYQ